MRILRHQRFFPPGWLLATSALAFMPPVAFANPQGAQVVGGSALIAESARELTVTQSTDRAIINWQSFDLASGDRTRFVQPSATSVVLNRVTGGLGASTIDGQITANGRVFLSNPQGIIFGANAQVNVGALIATTADTTDDRFMRGDMQFDIAGRPDASVVNHGAITAAQAGLVALVAPQVSNDGTINAQLGKVQLAGAETFTLDLYGDGLISIAAGPSVQKLAVENSGSITANGGQVVISTAQALESVDNLINLTGLVQADAVGTQSGDITLHGGGTRSSITTNGVIRANSDTGKGGKIAISAESVSLGGMISADGASGGDISVQAGSNLSLAENISARGVQAQGGTITIESGGRIIESSTSVTDASGATDGGSIRQTAADHLLTSGHKIADGILGKGGIIDVTARSIAALSAAFDAKGGTDGGRIRIGGEYQGGKNLSVDELPNAQAVLLNDATRINARGVSGAGGNAIVWSEENTAVHGSIDVSGTSGGFVELSSADTLLYRAYVTTGAGGTLLLDPKNITIDTTSGGVFDSNFALFGAGYSGGKNFNIGTLGSDHRLGASVSLDGNRMAVGAIYNNGASNTAYGTGAVYLFTFTDSAFSGAALEGTMGAGYVGGKNINVTSLENYDQFGYSVSLDGNRLAIGTPLDDGAGNVRNNNGTVYLFSFSDAFFSGGTLEATIGRGYNGGKNIDTTAFVSNYGSYFGKSVSLNGNRLAVGAQQEPGPNFDYSGSVYLFSFSNSTFSGGTLEAAIGKGQTGGKNIDVSSLGVFEYFGSAVSLDGNRLAVGAYGDDDFNNGTNRSGAVYLFSFTDSVFSGGQQEAVIGKGYSGGKNIDVSTLRVFNTFGYDVSLEGNHLAVGASTDNGASNGFSFSGAVYTFTFADAAFSGGALEAVIGKGYTGGNNIDITRLGVNHFFGTSVSLDGNRLAVGAPGDNSNAGAVYLFGAGAVASPVTDGDQFGDVSTSSITITPTALTTLLNAGTAVTLQASNDITVASAVTANNPGGNGGAFTLQAGRSILINANITTDNGNLTLAANSPAADGVVNAQRDAGDAVITMANGTAINAGSGAVDIQLKSGTGNTNTAAGDITLDDITANTIFAKNFSASDDVVLRSGAALTGAAAGTNVTLVSGRNFINSSGSSTPISTGAGRHLIYSTNPASDTLGGMTASFRRFSCTYGGSCPDFSGQSGSGFLYSYTPTLTATPSAINLTYGGAVPNLVGYSYGLTGYLGSDSGSDNVTGTLTGTTTYAQYNNVGSYNVNYSSGSLASALGYGFSYANNATAITVGKKALTAVMQDLGITYGTSTPTLSATNASHVAFSGFVNSEDASVIDSTTFSYGGATAGSINNAGAYTLGISAFSDNNYSLSLPGGVTTSTLTVAKKALTAVMQDIGITYGANTPTLSATNASHVAFSGFVNSEDASVIDSTTFSYGGATAGNVDNAGAYTLGISAFSDNNYSLALPGGVTTSTLTIAASSGGSGGSSGSSSSGGVSALLPESVLYQLDNDNSDIAYNHLPNSTLNFVICDESGVCKPL